ncbi:MAG: glycosyltransferase family 4 protein [Cetobacterium sp.]
MKILHINSYFYTNKIHENFFKKLDDIGLDNTCLILLNKSSNKESSSLGRLKIIKKFDWYDKFLIFSKMFKVEKITEKELQNKHYNLIHSHTLFTNGYAALRMKEKYDIDYIVSVRNTDVNVFFKKAIFLRRLGLKILKNAKKIIFISESLKKNFFEKYVSKKDLIELKHKSLVISNGIDDFWLKNKKEYKNYFYRDKINLLFVGALDDNKDALGLAQMIKDCKLSKEVVLRIVGDGKNKHKIESLAKEYPDKIIYYGKVKKKEKLEEIYSMTDIFIMVSKYETLGMVYLEALTQRIPIIYTKGQSVDGMISGKILFSNYYKDYSNLLELIKYIVSKIKNKEFDEEFKKEKFDRFLFDNIVENYKRIIR